MSQKTAVEEAIELIRNGMTEANAIDEVCTKCHLSLFEQAIVTVCIDAWQQHEYMKTQSQF